MVYRYDVVVIGAGVAGLNTSWVLAKKGYSVALVESKPREKIGDRACGDAIGLHHFKELGWMPPAKVLNGKYKGVKIVSPSEKYEIYVYGEGISVDSHKFGQWMLKRALDSGIELLDKHSLINIVVKDDVVESVLLKEFGKPGLREVKAKAFIDASGARPALRLKLPSNWPIAEKPYITDYNLAYREVLRLEKPIGEPDKHFAIIYLNTDIAPGGYWWLFPKKDGELVNIGLGVIWGREGYNPRHNYFRYLKDRVKGRIVHRGGGIVPTRRPMPTLVWRNVGVVGDAAYTVNPVHGGGRGSSMLAADIVAKYIANALEKGEVNEYTLWGANIEYMKAYGSKQAGLDILRMFMQKLGNEDYEFIMEKKLVSGEAVYDIGTKGGLREEIVRSLRAMIALISKPSLLNKLRIVKNYMEHARKLYLDQYPRDPDMLKQWMKDVEEFFNKYRAIIGFDPGPKVPW